MTLETTTHPMQLAWRASLALLGLVALAALVLGAIELAGVVEPGSLIGEASQAELIVAVLFGAALLPFTWTAWTNARLTLGPHALSFLRFGVLCRTDSIPLAEIRRWGVGHETHRGYRHRILLLELRDWTRRSLKLAMYSRQKEFLAAFAERVGAPSPVELGVTGLRFDDEPSAQ